MARRLQSLDDIPVTELSGVGSDAAKALASVEVYSVLDLLTYYPRRWIDRTKEAKIADLPVGEQGLVVATVRAVRTPPSRGRGKARVEVVVHDGTAPMTCTFFNQPWRARQLKNDMTVTLFGKLDVFRGTKQMVNPVVDLVGDVTGRFVPVYPQSEKAGIETGNVRRWVQEALKRAGELVEPLPTSILDEEDLVTRTLAMRWIHDPDDRPQAEAARKRLAFDELLRLQTILVLRKRAYERQARGIPHQVGEDGGPLVRQMLERLPFELTPAQRKAVEALQADMAGRQPMHRLLQGDVGSGKTLVALCALLTAVQGGWQGAFMAPTEVLAEQHALTIRPLLEGITVDDAGTTLFGARDLRVELLTNRTTAKQRASIMPALAAGEVDLLIGTHALIEETVDFARLGCVVVDEQHRFGVEQRARLREKGKEGDPDLLVMTATPIPRTAAMTVFGDLDMTVLDELPPGRTPVATTWARAPLDVAKAWQEVREQVAAGRQAYVVCPLVEESEKLEVASAKATFAEVSAGELEGLRLGLLHGQLPSSEKEAVMGQFRRGELDVLVATTVIEVGVDVPNATVMIVLDADRFGLAQLHQLRGRVGRGSHQSHCFLLGGTDEHGQPTSEEVKTRLSAMESKADGFDLAEIDLELRGEGTILGVRQKGRTDLKLASLRRDKALVASAREVAFTLVGLDGRGLERKDLAEWRDEVGSLVDQDEAEYLFKS